MRKRWTNHEEELTFLLLLIALSSTPITFCSATDIINRNQAIKDRQTLISSDGRFEMGFFSPVNSMNRWYAGIWYKKIAIFTVVWVANRDNPLPNTSNATLTVVEPGLLVLLNGSNGVVWSSSNATAVARNPIAQLQDSGNLVVRESDNENPDNYIWQSFDHPTDTLLPGMKLGRNLASGQDSYLTSWRTNDDPAVGNYTYRLDPTGYPELILRRGSDQVYSTGPWNGISWTGIAGPRTNPVYAFELVLNSKEVYYRYDIFNSSVISRLTLNQSGSVQRWAWLDRNQAWALFLNTPVDACDTYRQCGAYGSCNAGHFPICECLDRFNPRRPEEWASGDFSHGCVRRTNLNCTSDGFRMYSGIKLPNTRDSWFNESMSLGECEAMCRRNCSCVAYANLNISNGGSGCLLWFGDLVDIKELYPLGDDIYIRLASSELDSKKKSSRKVLIVCLTLMGIFLLGLAFIICIKKRNNIYLRLMKGGRQHENQNSDIELPVFHVSIISKATKNFSRINKLGEGGFGPVYKGMLEDGQEIAVKRLSETSMQGTNEFKNEVVFIAKLQHRNLVKILGCCIQAEEKMLIYEYMPNGSLDLILFDENKSKLLDWPKRVHIINGIARGILYLHQDSRLRIIHRDLKASNILLDTDMSPKISDFGLARSFRGNEIEANTSRVVGTYGYMSPEYAIDGLFSLKSDVFSFGVLVLEILSGKRNRGFYHEDHHHNLLGHAWLLFKEGRSLELMDSNLGDSCYLSEALRSIHVGLLCVQKYPEDRPTMSSVIFMLENEIVLPLPKEPGFFTERDAFIIDTSTSTKTTSTNEFTISVTAPR